MRDDVSDRLERIVGRVLRTGAAVSTVLLAAGLGLHLVAPGGPASAALLRAGLVVLMATPVGRVVASVIQYSVERDWLFAALTGCVLVVLLGSLLFGLGS
jgi:uncharacterized membrane protein